MLTILLVPTCRREPAFSTAELEEIAHPDLAAVEEVVRRQLEEGRSRLEAALAKGSDRREMADAYGGLGELYHAYGLFGPAVSCYRNAGRLDPGSFLWPYYLGTVQQTAGDLEAALASLERAAALRAEDGPNRLRLGEVELARGNPAAAEAHFRAVLEDERFAAAAHFGLGRAAAARGNAGAAVEHFEEVLELQPGAGAVHHRLGMALRRLVRPEEAASHLEERGAGEVDFPDRLMERVTALARGSAALMKRGNRALVNGRLDEAIDLYRRAVEADPEASEARRNLAIALVRRGDVDAALQELRRAAATDPDNAWIHFDLGNAYLQKGLAVEALGALHRAVELAPDFTSAHFNLANALIGLGRWGEARPHLSSVLELEPLDGRARYLEAMTRHRTGETGAAIAGLEELLRDDPANVVARQGLVSIFAETGRLPRATRACLEALELDVPAAEKARLLAQLAELTWKAGRRRAAIDHWRRAVELQPDSSPAHTALANGLQLVGERAEARRHFAQAVELDPGNATAWLSEARLWILDGGFRTARERLEEALARVPDHPGLNDTLARLLATCPEAGIRDGRRALELARKAWGLQSSIDHAETVAMALAELGRFEEALRWQRGLIHQAARAGDQAALQRLAARLKIYESRRPARIGGG